MANSYASLVAKPRFWWRKRRYRNRLTLLQALWIEGGTEDGTNVLRLARVTRQRSDSIEKRLKRWERRGLVVSRWENAHFPDGTGSIQQHKYDINARQLVRRYYRLARPAEFRRALARR